MDRPISIRVVPSLNRCQALGIFSALGKSGRLRLLLFLRRNAVIVFWVHFVDAFGKDVCSLGKHPGSGIILLKL